ncbi:MAG: Wzz/FepE/Etk N-terminal domain-containing protein [Lachnospiraceae bacterium]|nr:Wzz/FepE/Etk N-terminal domain-containing protein [Lachnospiraceae bacterium]
MEKNNINQEIEIDLLLMIKDILRKWWVLLIGAVLGGLVVFLITTFLLTPRYQSSATLYVLGSGTSVTSFADIQIGGALAEDFLMIARSRPVLDGVVVLAEEEGVILTRDQVSDMLQVSSQGTRMVSVSAISTDPVVAQVVADAASRAAVTRIEQVTQSDPPSVVEVAEVPREPIASRINYPIGVGAGILLMIIVLVIRFILNDNIKSEEDVMKYLNLNTLVVIPNEKKKAG